ncbi:MAG: hypothetical protein U1E86_25960 [Burkholderiaceae bacterium]
MPQSIPTTPAAFDSARIIERPDGFYWESLEDGREYGPFATLVETVLDMQSMSDDEEVEGDDVDDVREAGEALGVPQWIDPETGHLADDEWTRTEDH